jgi:hypothetical protein
MPRRHRSAREREAPLLPPERPRGVAPEWAAVEGVKVQASMGEKGRTYRCPGCQQEIRPGVAHLVVMEYEDVEFRRHWHTPCWHSELRRRGIGR